MDVKKLGKYGEILNMSLVSIILYCMYYPPVINIAMENGQFIDVVWWFTYQKWWFSIATLNNQRVYIYTYIIWNYTKSTKKPVHMDKFK